MNPIYLAAVCHDIKSNTLEATWIQRTDTEIRRVKCQNYSPSQADMLRADDLEFTGSNGVEIYIAAAGWTPEYIAAYTAEQERLAAEVQAKADAEARAAEDARLAAEKVAFDAAVAKQLAILKAAQDALK